MNIRQKMTIGSLSVSLLLALVACQSPGTDASKPAKPITESVLGPAPVGPAPTVATPDAASSLDASAKQWVWWRGVNLASA